MPAYLPSAPLRHHSLFLVMALAALAAGCGGGNSSGGSGITSPTPNPPAVTRIANVSGNLAFGDVPVGSSRR